MNCGIECTSANSAFAIGGVYFRTASRSCSADIPIDMGVSVAESFVLRINICGENRHLRQARNRYQ